MPKVKTFKQGEFTWCELVTNDVAGATTFFTQLFGWQTQEIPLPQGGVYTMCSVNGTNVGGITPPMPGAEGPPAYWNSYIAVDDVDLIAKEAEQAGATILAQPMDVMDQGRMAVIGDPTGAAISLWKDAGGGDGVLIGEPGSRVWNELVTNDVPAAKGFYTGLFGYGTDEQPMPTGDGTYTTLKLGDTPWAGIMQGRDEWNMPPSWIVYFGVEDAKATAAKCTELGGQVPFPPTEIPGVGTTAWLQDPTGGSFGILQPE